MSFPNLDQLNAAKAIRQTMFGWMATDRLISYAIQANPQNDNHFVVFVKLRLINRSYSTNIIAEDKVARKLSRKGSLLQELIGKGDAEAVRIIAECGIGRKEQVFASKYVHFHNPDKFVLGDRLVDIALRALKLNAWNPHSHKKEIAVGYEVFRGQVSDISQRCGISLKEMDQYLWLRGQKEVAKKQGKTKLNREIRWSMRTQQRLWNEL
jgi:hypothetical protein